MKTHKTKKYGFLTCIGVKFNNVDLEKYFEFAITEQ